MMKKTIIIFAIILLVSICAVSVWLINKYRTNNIAIHLNPDSIATISVSPRTSSSPSISSTQVKTLADPVADFKTRITKKPFGIYITPENSPVQPEKFTGYHTGVDVEYNDVILDTPVYSIVNGEVVANQFVSGYGGVLVVRHDIEGQKILILYGHLNLENSPKIGDQVQINQQIAILGKDKSAETEGERKHLHFGMIKGDSIDYRGYVPSEFQLSGWHNPLDFYK